MEFDQPIVPPDFTIEKDELMQHELDINIQSLDASEGASLENLSMSLRKYDLTMGQ
jgi:hypothetical protein